MECLGITKYGLPCHNSRIMTIIPYCQYHIPSTAILNQYIEFVFLDSLDKNLQECKINASLVMDQIKSHQEQLKQHQMEMKHKQEQQLQQQKQDEWNKKQQLKKEHQKKKKEELKQKRKERYQKERKEYIAQLQQLADPSKNKSNELTILPMEEEEEEEKVGQLSPKRPMEQKEEQPVKRAKLTPVKKTEFAQSVKIKQPKKRIPKIELKK